MLFNALKYNRSTFFLGIVVSSTVLKIENFTTNSHWIFDNGGDQALLLKTWKVTIIKIIGWSFNGYDLI